MEGRGRRRDKENIPRVFPEVRQHPADKRRTVAGIGDDRRPVRHLRAYVTHHLLIGVVDKDDNTFGSERKDGVKQPAEIRPAHDRPQVRGG